MNVNRESLKIQRIANCDVFVGKGIKTPWERLFGGQTLAQSLMSACGTVDLNYPVHSLHAYFILAGDSTKEILFNVERTRDGGSFKTRSVKAMQDNKAICHMQASFHRQEAGLEYQIKLKDLMPNVDIPSPEKFEGVQSEGFSSNILRHTIAEGKNWKATFVRVQASTRDMETATWRTHCSMLTFLSDQGMVSSVRQPFEKEAASFSMSLSLDHSIHFHKPFNIRVDEWMIFYTFTAASAVARGTATTYCFSAKTSELVATFHQEALIRPRQHPASKM